MKVSPAECRLGDSQGMREGRLEDPARRSTHLVVAAVEVGLRTGVVVRDHHAYRDRRPREAGERDRRSCYPTSVRDGVPDAEACDDERDFLLARRRREREHGEREQPVFVQVPESEEQQGRRERDRMKLVQRQPAGCGIEQVGERKPEPSARAKRDACGRAGTRESRRAQSPPPAPRGACSGSARSTRAGANSTRIGSTWAANREIWSPCRVVIRRGSPCAVDHTACTMFPRSKRPVTKAS